MSFKVVSKKTGSYFGSYISKAAAETDAEQANVEEKNGQDDWEAEEKAGGADVGDKVQTPQGYGIVDQVQGRIASVQLDNGTVIQVPVNRLVVQKDGEPLPEEVQMACDEVEMSLKRLKAAVRKNAKKE